MIDILINISKVSIKSIFTAKKYDNGILEEDLRRIVFIRHLLEENSEFVKENYQDIDAKLYVSELKKYALELFLKQCEDARSEGRNSKEYDFENHTEEDIEYFNYIYLNMESPY